MQAFSDVKSYVVPNVGDDLAVKFTQDIPQSFLDDLKERRNESAGQPIGDMLHAARIPVAIIEGWMRQGFDFYKEPASKIMARLRNESLDGFIVTDKRV